MFRLHGVAVPASLVNQIPALREVVEFAGVETFLGGTSRFAMNYAWVAIAAGIAFGLPNSQELVRRFGPALDAAFPGLRRTALAWRPDLAWAVGLGLLAAVALLSLSRPSEFLYFQF